MNMEELLAENWKFLHIKTTDNMSFIYCNRLATCDKNVEFWVS